MRIFAFTITGVSSSRRSNNLAITDKMIRFVTGSAKDNSKENVKVSLYGCQNRPRAGTTIVSVILTVTECVRLSSGIDSRIVGSLLLYFCNGKPPAM